MSARRTAADWQHIHARTPQTAHRRRALQRRRYCQTMSRASTITWPRQHAHMDAPLSFTLPTPLPSHHRAREPACECVPRHAYTRAPRAASASPPRNPPRPPSASCPNPPRAASCTRPRCRIPFEAAGARPGSEFAEHAQGRVGQRLLVCRRHSEPARHRLPCSRVRVRTCVCVRACAYVRVRTCVRVRACVRACERVRACVRACVSGLARARARRTSPIRMLAAESRTAVSVRGAGCVVVGWSGRGQ